MAPFASVRPVREPRFRSTLSDVTARTIGVRRPASPPEVECQLARARQPSLGIVLRRIVGSWLISAALKGRESIPGR
jgi:hypothetical protein